MLWPMERVDGGRRATASVEARAGRVREEAVHCDVLPTTISLRHLCEARGPVQLLFDAIMCALSSELTSGRSSLAPRPYS